MAFYRKKRIYVPRGATVVWKKDPRTGKIKPAIVRRRAYYKTIKIKNW